MIPEHATGSVKNGDVELFYRRLGRPGATPVLIVHGLSFFLTIGSRLPRE